MALVIVIVCVVMIILILFMFLILKNTVKIVNNQTKSYSVNKLQDYDDLILAKENKERLPKFVQESDIAFLWHHHVRQGNYPCKACEL